MKSVYNIFILLAMLILWSCSARININESLIGEWQRLDCSTMPNTIITYNEIILQEGCTCTYHVTDNGRMDIIRNWVSKGEPDYETTCQFWFNHDTLTITNMQVGWAEIYPPFYYPITLKKVGQ